MAQQPTNLNSPPQGPEAIDRKTGMLSGAWASWFSALGAVASWAVAGALSAASAVIGATGSAATNLTVNGAATITKLLTAGSLLLTTAGVPPFSGTLFADTGWTTVNAFGGTWVAGGFAVKYRRMQDGTVRIIGQVTGGVLGTTAFTLPVGYRPSQRMNLACVANSAFAVYLVNTDGTVVPSLGSATNFNFEGPTFLAEA